MGFDSSANLLFTIGANADDASANIQRFRTLLSKDLGAIEAEFTEWAKKVLSVVSTPIGMMATGAAGAVAAIGAVAAVAKSAHSAYMEFVAEVGKGAKTMQVSAQDASVLHFAVGQVGGDYEGVAKGVAYFESMVVKANAGGKEQLAWFDRVGVSRKQLADGERNIIPLLGAVGDKWRELASGAQRAAIAREGFSRQWEDMAGVLKLGSDGLARVREEAEQLGLILTKKDIEAVKLFKLATAELEDQHKALQVEIGRSTIVLAQFWEYTKIGFVDALKTWSQGSGGALSFFTAWGMGIAAAKARVEALLKSMGALRDQTGKLGETVSADAQNWYGLSSLLESVKGKIAGATDEAAKNAEEISHLQWELKKATEEYRKLAAEGKLTSEAAQREAAVMAELPERIQALAGQLAAQLAEKRADALSQAHADLMRRIAEQSDEEEGARAAAWNAEIDQLREQYRKEKRLTAENEELLVELRVAGLTKIARERSTELNRQSAELMSRIEAQGQQTYELEERQWRREIEGERARLAEKFQLKGRNQELLEELEAAGLARIARARAGALSEELLAMQGSLAQIVLARMTGGERIRFQGELELEELRRQQERRLQVFKVGEGERAALEDQYALNRHAINQRTEEDLQALQNSQGWQGVFGSRFGQLLQGDEAALRRWVTAHNQAHSMVALSLKALEGIGKQAFGTMAQGMGQNIAHAIVYSQSIREAMRAAAAATLESIAAESFIHAIYATALGFLRLAQHDYPAAASAFQAAAIFGGVGAAAAVAGRAIAPRQDAGEAAGGGKGSGSGSGASMDSAASNAQQQGPVTHITLNIQGSIHSTESIIDAINEAVTQRDKRLTATDTTTGKVVRR